MGLRYQNVARQMDFLWTKLIFLVTHILLLIHYALSGLTATITGLKGTVVTITRTNQRRKLDIADVNEVGDESHNINPLCNEMFGEKRKSMCAYTKLTQKVEIHPFTVHSQ